MKNQPVGKTRDTGWQIGIRRTLPIDCHIAWALITSGEGLAAWLTEEPLDFTVGTSYRLADGTIGQIRVFKPLSHLRLTWHPPGWPKPSTIQVRVIDKGEKTVIAFHQEHLPGPDRREQRRAHFTAALDVLGELVDQE